MTRLPTCCLQAVLAASLLAASTSQAQTCPNSCSPAITGPKEGVHTQFAGSTDAILWPPNHKLKTIRISAVNNDGDACDVTIVDARQDEPVNGRADGSTSPDAMNCVNTGPESSIDLRGERAGNGTGRFYHVSFTMNDPDCPLLPSMGDAVSLVPHDQGVSHLGLWIDEGPLYKSYTTTTLTCTP